jgi:PAS domain S-box-containing protein/putative nucleotidyltransferase with HDIG domain
MDKLARRSYEISDRYDALFDRSSEAICIVDLKGKIVDANRQALKLLGYEKADVNSLSAAALIPPGYLRDASHVLKELVDTGVDNTVHEIKVRRSDGTLLDIACTVCLVNQAGKPVAAMVVARDISIRKAIEDELSRSEERYRTILEEMADAYYEVDLKGNFTFINHHVCEHTGYSREELLGANFHMLTPKEEQDSVFSAFSHVYRTGEPNRAFSQKIVTRDGATRYVEGAISLIRDKQGKATGFRSVSRDVTQRRQLEEALRLNEWFYRLLAENVTDSIWLIDMNLKVIYVSPSTEKIRGLTAQELKEIPIEKQVTPASLQKAMAAFAEAMAKLKEDPSYHIEQMMELELYHKDGSTFWTDNSFSLVRDDKGKPLGILVVGRDISERKKAEEELRRINEQLQKAITGVVETISVISELRDPYTAGHQQQVSRLATAIAEEMKLSEKKITAIRISGILHDIGKVSIPSEILSKPGRLNKIEIDLIQNHPQVGREILKTIEFPWPVCRFVAEHHERIDGSGYPDHLKGDKISIEARILAVADVVSAMSSHRPYRAALGLDKALEEITSNRGILYDAAVVDACLRLFNEKGFKLD